MRRPLFTVTIIAAFLIADMIIPIIRCSNAIRLIKVGMTSAQVHDRLGTPAERGPINVNSTYFAYQYCAIIEYPMRLGFSKMRSAKRIIVQLNNDMVIGITEQSLFSN